MKVLKFGGSSLATAQKILSVVSIIEDRVSNTEQEALQEEATSSVAIVVSAPGGVTNQLVGLIDSLRENNDTEGLLDKLHNGLVNITEEIENAFSGKNVSLLSIQVEDQFNKLHKLIEGVKLLGHCPEQTQAQILTFGERLSILFL